MGKCRRLALPLLKPDTNSHYKPNNNSHYVVYLRSAPAAASLFLFLLRVDFPSLADKESLLCNPFGAGKQPLSSIGHGAQ